MSKSTFAGLPGAWILRSLVRTVILPREMSAFERSYLARMNRIALVFFGLHIPALMLIAFCDRTGWQWAFALSTITAAGPLIAHFGFAATRPRLVSAVHGMTAMLMGGLLVHFGQGPVQVEMHFYFFSLLAMCVIFANPMVIVAAAVTVALHHLTLFLLLPTSLLNYAAPLWVVGVHAGFVVLESFACVFIARATFDNLIRLEKTVIRRTHEVEQKTRDLRLVLDHVDQGLVTIDLEGHVVVKSAAFDRWFGDEGTRASDVSIFEQFAIKDPSFGASSSADWTQVQMDMLPLELVLDQMPSRAMADGRHFNVRYLPITETPAPATSAAPAIPSHYLVVVTDVTSQVEREKAENQRREALVIFERILADPRSLLEFREEGSRFLEVIRGFNKRTNVSSGKCVTAVGRALHTLKGNSAILGIGSLERICHDLESSLVANGPGVPLDAIDLHELEERWAALVTELDHYLGARTDFIAVKGDDITRLETLVRRGAAREAILRHIHELRLEPTETRLTRFGDQAKRLGKSLGRAPIEVVIEAHDERADATVLAPFWSAFTHLVRNAIDHGAETSEERIEHRKTDHVTLTLSTSGDADRFVVEVADDGRGIDWGKLARRAESLGLPSADDDALVRALFTDGLSTADGVSEISGRGIGMGAVLQSVNDLGGTISVTSETYRGTRVRAEFPRSVALALPNEKRGPSLQPTSNAA